MAQKSKKNSSKDLEMEDSKKGLISENMQQTQENHQSSQFEMRSACGGALRAAREKLGLSTQEIANRLRLSSKQIEALEADNFSVLPETTIVKGFIRNYAKQLKIDAAPLLNAYNAIVPEQAPQSFTLKSSVDMKVTPYEKPDALRYVMLSLAALVAIGAWFFYQNYVQKPSPIKPTAELPAAKADEPLPEVALPAAERVGGADSQLTTASTVPANAAELPVAAGATPAALAPVGQTPISSPLTPQPPASQLPSPSTPTPLDANLPATNQKYSSQSSNQFEKTIGMSKLEFTASQETWISVTDARGKEVFGKTLFGGNREVLQAKAPLNVTVGNALGTTLSVDGKSVDLAPHTRTNVAHIKVD